MAANTLTPPAAPARPDPGARSAVARSRTVPFFRAVVDEQALVQRYTSDRWSQAQCARRFGISPGQARAILLRHDVQLRTPGPPAPLDEQAVIRAYTRHRSISYVAATMKAEWVTIRYILDKHGVPHGDRRRPPEAGAGTPEKRALFSRGRPGAELAPAGLLWPYQAARILRMTVPELYEAARAGQIAEARSPGGYRRYARRDVLDLAQRLAPARRRRGPRP